MIFGLAMLAAGLFFCWMAVRLWKYREGGSINVLEAAVLKATGEEPLPRARVDVWLHYFQLAMSTIFGVILVAGSIYGLLEEAGVI